MPTITTTLGALVQAERPLSGLCALKLSAKSAYHLQKLARLVAVETKHFHDQRNALITELGTKRPDGTYAIEPDGDGLDGPNPAMQTFITKLNELAAVDVTIAWGPITLAMLGDEKVSAAELGALGPLVAEPEAEPGA